MDVLITFKQRDYLIKLLTEDIDLNKSVDFSKVSSLDDLKNAVTSTGLQHGEETKTRNRSLELRKMLSAIDKLEDKEIFEKYFTKLSDLISIYKKDSFSLKKLSEIIIDLSNLSIVVFNDTSQAKGICSFLIKSFLIFSLWSAETLFL